MCITGGKKSGVGMDICIQKKTKETKTKKRLFVMLNKKK
jgi:hypothetical protein